MSLAAGRLHHRITIEEPVEVTDSSGLRTKEWEVWADNVAAAVEPLSAREFTASQAMQSAIVGKVTLRYRPGLRADMRIMHRGQYFNLAGIIPDNNSGLEWITIPYTAGVTAT
jgi:SPP1 family predicted phage head-tail adaptor